MSAVASDSHTFVVPLPWVVRRVTRLPAGASVLDVVCGSGRHVRWLAVRDLCLTSIDRDAVVLSGLAGIAETIVADIEDGPWPLPIGATFDAAVATNYPHRPLWPYLLAAVAPGGRLIYETFADGNEIAGKSSNSAFLLTPDRLLDAVRGPMRMVGYEDGFFASSRDAHLQRIYAVREPSGAVAPRYVL